MIKIGMAGAGGIGSNVARHLVQYGMTRILTVDYDRIEPSNLNRQFFSVHQIGQPKVACLRENLAGINPNVDIETRQVKLLPGDGKDVFKDCAIVVEGFDDALAKKSLVEDLAGLNIPMVCASGIAGRDMDSVKVRQVGNCHIVGDFATDVKDELLFPPKIAMIAAMMAGIVLELARDMDVQNP